VDEEAKEWVVQLGWVALHTTPTKPRSFYLNIGCCSAIDMASKNQGYPYKALPADRDKIRLLNIETQGTASSSNPGQAISLSLSEASLDDNPRYAALSYAWGDSERTTPIQLDSHSIEVTQNLHDALSHIQNVSGMENTPLWADALCINQADMDEKAAQVQLMGRIYRQAELVIVWLGPDEPDGSGSAALHAVRDLGIYFRQLRTAPGFDNAKIITFVHTVLQFSDTADTPSQSGEQKTGRFDFESIWRFFRKRAWWRRVWIIQEVALARKTAVMCGNHSVVWEDLRECLQVFEWMILYPDTDVKYRRLYHILGDIYPNVSHIGYSSDGYKRSLEESSDADKASFSAGMSLLETIMWTSTGTGDAIESTDPRDRIYGLLGMVREEDRKKIKIDYTADSTISKVLFDVTKALVEEHGPDVFSFCRETTLSATLPSWVPDWTADRIPIIGGVDFGKESDYNASKGTAWIPVAIGASYSSPGIKLRGNILGSIKKVGSEFKTSPNTPTYLEDYRKWIIELTEMIMEGFEALPDRQDALDSLWRVPIRDLALVYRADNEDPEKLIQGFDVLVGKTPAPSNLDETGQAAWVMSESWGYRRCMKVYYQSTFVDWAGRPGLGPLKMAHGDELALFAGAHVPFVLRSVKGCGYRLLGPAYVNGLMDGQGLSIDTEPDDIYISM
jgi:hypothetical protein